MIVVALIAVIAAFVTVGPTIGLALFGALLAIVCAIGLACDEYSRPNNNKENQS